MSRKRTRRELLLAAKSGDARVQYELAASYDFTPPKDRRRAAHWYRQAKTVADCFKYRNKIGLDVALEALRDYRRSRRPLDELHRATEICRVERVVRPYLEAMA